MSIWHRSGVYIGFLLLAALVALALIHDQPNLSVREHGQTLHYTSGGTGSAIATAGFNLADVQYVSQLNALPLGMKGLVWLGERAGNTSAFRAKVDAFIGNPRLFGFYLCDEPEPTGRWSPIATPASNLKAEVDYIKSKIPTAKTFIVLMNLGSNASPSFMNPLDPTHGAYNPATTGIDLYGLGYYAYRTETAPDLTLNDRFVAAAMGSGIPLAQLVPIYQAFGGGNWTNSGGGKYVMPSPTQMQAMLDHWKVLCPNPAFDYAYKWGTQNGDMGLESAPTLQVVFKTFNAAAADESRTSHATLVASWH
jgi:serralysin